MQRIEWELGALLRRDPFDLAYDPRGKMMLFVLRQRFDMLRENEQHLVAVGVEADARLGDVVGDDQVTTLALQLLFRVRFKVPRLCGKADEGAGEAEVAAHGAEDVGGADEFEGEGVAGFLDFL